jgi:hypothetical protein
MSAPRAGDAAVSAQGALLLQKSLSGRGAEPTSMPWRRVLLVGIGKPGLPYSIELFALMLQIHEHVLEQEQDA